MASSNNLAHSSQLQPRARIRSPSPSIVYPTTARATTSTSSPSSSRTRQSARLERGVRQNSSESKENEVPGKEAHNSIKMSVPVTKMNGRMSLEEPAIMSSNGHAGIQGEAGSESATASGSGSGSTSSTIRARRAGVMSPGTAKRQMTDPTYNGLPTLPTIGDDDDAFLSSGPSSPSALGRAPPPAPSARAGSDPNYGSIAGSGPRKRRASSIKRKLSPGVTPQKAVDWEIPRKAFHSSIGFVTLILWFMDPPSVKPLITVLSIGLVSVLTLDFFRLKYPAFAELWESYFGILMRESERDQINGVVWYLIGVIFVLTLYPRDVAVVSILTLSWSDTTASTIGRLWGKHTPPLPAHFPLIPAIRFAPRKSLAGFLAATVTGFLICMTFWARGSNGHWAILNGGWAGLTITSVVIGVGGAVAEALDLGLDDNLTLPILSGALMWIWLSITNVLLR